MHDPLKNSLNKIFENELIENDKRKVTESKRKKPFIPIVITVCLLILLSVITISVVRNAQIAFPGTTTSSSADRATLDHLYGEYVGNNSAVGEITSKILYPFNINKMELHTKQEPYGVTIYSSDSIPQHMRYKHAFYMFSLIPNVEYIEYMIPEMSSILDRTTIQSNYFVDFSSIKGDEAILTTYYKTMAAMLPQIQTSREDSYKILFNAIHTNSFMSDFDTVKEPQSSFMIDGEQYILWIENDKQIVLVNVEKPNTALIVKGRDFKVLHQFLTEDHVLVTEAVKEIKNNQLLLESKSSSITKQYLVTVDDGSYYEQGDIITVWASKATDSNPVQATATRIQYK